MNFKTYTAGEKLIQNPNLKSPFSRIKQHCRINCIVLQCDVFCPYVCAGLPCVLQPGISRQRSRTSGTTKRDSCLITLTVPIPLTDWLTWILLLCSSTSSRCMSTNMQLNCIMQVIVCILYTPMQKKKDQQETVLSCHSADVKTDVPWILWWCVLPVQRYLVLLFRCLNY